MNKDKPRLGRGLASLLGSVAEPVSASAQGSHDFSVLQAADAPHLPGAANLTRLVPLNRIEENPYQPRLERDEQALGELAESIRQHGIIQPIVVRPHGEQYELVAGQRRLEAARRLGLPAIPAVVRDASDQQMLELALIENIHREDLNCVDRASAYKKYQDTFSFSTDQIAQRLGQDRTTVTNYLRLLTLSEQVLTLLRTDRLSMGHARAVAGLDDPEDQTKLAFKIAQFGLSVRQAESIVSKMKSDGTASHKTLQKNPNVLDLEQQMTRSLSAKVQIMPARKKGTGKVVIEYYSLDDFDRILEKICGAEREEL